MSGHVLVLLSRILLQEIAQYQVRLLNGAFRSPKCKETPKHQMVQFVLLNGVRLRQWRQDGATFPDVLRFLRG